MKTLKENGKYIFLTYINLMIIIEILAKCFDVRDFSYVDVNIIFFLVIFIGWLYKEALSRLSYKILFTVAVLLIIVFAILIDFYLKKYFISSFFNMETSNAYGLIVAFKNGEEIKNRMILPYLVIISPFILPIMIKVFKSKYANFINFLVVFVVLYEWFHGYHAEVYDSIFKIMFISLVSFAMIIVEKNYREAVKNGFEKMDYMGSNYIFIIIFCLVISTFCLIVPKNFDFKLSNDKKNNSSSNNGANGDGINLIDVRNKYDMSLAGYKSSDTKLGGPIVLNDIEAFKINSNKVRYLRGITKNYYDGFSWKGTLDTFKGKGNGEFIKLSEYKGLENLLGGKSNITIYPRNFTNENILSPLYTDNVVLGGRESTDRVFYNTYDNSLLSEHFISEPYELEFYSGSSSFEITNNRVNNEVKKVMDGLYDEYKVKAGPTINGYKDYLQVPDNVSNNLRELVKNITKDSNSESDKVSKIREYLSANYKYSLKVSDVPQGSEFIDYFLNTEKKGYCTYFATATTIFCRLAGVPARYVEGYYVKDKKDENNLYVVTNKSAHAWTEVLISPKISAWAIVDCVPDPEELINKEENSSYSSNEGDTSMDVKLKNKNLKDMGDEIGYTEKKDISASMILFIPLIIIFILVINIVYINLRKKYLLKTQSIKALYIYLLKRLKVKKNLDKTEKEYFEEVNNEVLRELMMPIVEDLYKEIYGDKKINISKRINYYNNIENYLRKREGFCRYYYKKILSKYGIIL